MRIRDVKSSNISVLLHLPHSLHRYAESLVRTRLLAILIAAFQAVWLIVIVPGHLRGIVQMSKPGQGLDCPSCCCEDAPARKPGQPFTPDQQKNCAVCFFTAHMSLPPVIAFDHQPLGLLQRLKPHECDDLFDRIVLLPFDSCGPPAIA
jgi:hypothetical protein